MNNIKIYSGTAFDTEGNACLIEVWQNSLYAGYGKYIPGIIEIKTSDGIPLNRIGKGMYVFANGTEIKTNDPHAP